MTMKTIKHNKRLSLNVETIKRLDDDLLLGVVGGACGPSNGNCVAHAGGPSDTNCGTHAGYPAQPSNGNCGTHAG
jgi:hypothetical protein